MLPTMSGFLLLEYLVFTATATPVLQGYPGSQQMSVLEHADFHGRRRGLEKHLHHNPKSGSISRAK
jgi:hypothetical protein